MNGEMSVDHLQRQTDRPVPNEQHRESHSLKVRLLLYVYANGQHINVLKHFVYV